MRYRLAQRLSLTAILFGPLAAATAAGPGKVTVSPLLRGCSALVAKAGEKAPELADDLERRIRLAMAWPEEGAINVGDFANDDGIPTYLLYPPTGLGALVRISLPGQAEGALATEMQSAAYGADLELGPRPVDVETAGILVLRDLPGVPIESKAARPLKEVAKAFRTLHAAPVPAHAKDASLVKDFLAAIERERTALGANADTIRQALERLAIALGETAKVPCLRGISADSARIDGRGNVRFYFWNRFAKADPAEDYAHLAKLLSLDGDETKDFLGKVLQREAKPAELARVKLYRMLLQLVPDPATANAAALLKLVSLVNTTGWRDAVAALAP